MKAIVIAGNGPSLKEIDYRRLPKEYDVFRCNQFFFEDKYYLGKKVTGFFASVSSYSSLFVTMTELENREEYNIDDIYCNTMLNDKEPSALGDPLFSVKGAYNIFCQNQKIARFINQESLYRQKNPTTGISMLLTAVALGYTDIYIVGIDFYEGSNLFAFSIDHATQLKEIDQFYKIIKDDVSIMRGESHSTEHDMQCVALVSRMKNIKLHSIVPDSKLSTLLPLAPIQNDTPYIPIEKPKNYLNDIILAEQDRRAQKGIKQKIKNIFIKKDLKNEWEFIRQNSLVRFIYQTIKLPYIILKIIIKLIK